MPVMEVIRNPELPRVTAWYWRIVCVLVPASHVFRNIHAIRRHIPIRQDKLQVK